MALLQFGADLAEEIAKMQDAKFDLFFGAECSIIRYYGRRCQNGAGIFAGDRPAADTGPAKGAKNHTGRACRRDWYGGKHPQPVSE